MPGIAPPYALETITFRFPALASCAGRAPLGTDRDLALGVYMTARLALALLPPVRLDPSCYATRAERAKTWLVGLTMPQPARMALLRAFDATAGGSAPGSAVSAAVTADALAELAQTVTGHIDAQSQQELSDMVASLRLYYEQQTGTPIELHPERTR